MARIAWALARSRAFCSAVRSFGCRRSVSSMDRHPRAYPTRRRTPPRHSIHALRKEFGRSTPRSNRCSRSHRTVSFSRPFFTICTSSTYDNPLSTEATSGRTTPAIRAAGYNSRIARKNGVAITPSPSQFGMITAIRFAEIFRTSGSIRKLRTITTDRIRQKQIKSDKDGQNNENKVQKAG